MEHNKIDWQKEIEKISNWIKNYTLNAGAKGLVVGTSGGIDSAVIACLAVKAVGKENVIGVSIPCQSREDMNTDAEQLAKNLGILYCTIPIENSYNNLINSLLTSQLTKANIKARLRMVVLYAIANQSNYLVAGTGNLSELKIGFFSKFGDGGVDFEAIGNYYKSEVYKMAELMPEIPNSTILKAPSADLWENQTDEQEIGMSYNELDTILINIGGDSEKLLNIEKVNKVKNMIKKAEHKNNLPPRYIRD